MKAPLADIIMKMIRISNGNVHDINHFLKVYSFAKTIGERELKDETFRSVLEVAAVLHDIACPVCREKYGSTAGKLQEEEGGPLAQDFLEEFGLPEVFIDRVVWLVAHHHSYNDITMLEHRILLEADFLVNADESSYSKEQIESAKAAFFRTATGTSLLDSIYLDYRSRL